MNPLPASITASWIWRRQESYTPYHQVILARKTFRLAISADRPAPGLLKIAVDGGYRLFVNGEWAADGPARSWPEHFQYDQIDVTPYLRSGLNELAVIARHWQTGDFHTRPCQAGLLVQLDLRLANGHLRRIASDDSWETAMLEAWSSATPKVSIQMEPQELYDPRTDGGDARLAGQLAFTPAAVLYPAGGGPWQDLHPRDTALLARRPVHLRRFLGAKLVRRKTDLNFCLPAARLASPAGTVEANHSQSAAGGMATVLELASPGEVRLALDGMAASIDGLVSADGHYSLAAGRHLLLAFAWPIFSHRKERYLRIVEPPVGLRLVNPQAGDPPDCREDNIGPAAIENPWVYLSMPEYALAENDLAWIWFQGPDGRRDAAAANYRAAIDVLLSQFGAEAASLGAEAASLGADAASFSAWLDQPGQGITARQLTVGEMFVSDTHWLFANREVLGSAAQWVTHPSALMYDNAELTTVSPAPGDDPRSDGGDIELAYDLGDQTVGYFDLELVAPAGVTLDLYAVEYIAPDGTVQHTGDNHNGLRYITHAGLNRFTSLKRRAGRYLFLTLRGLREAAPLQLRLVRVIESTYPAEQVGAFDCSDANLGRVWQISARTLQLCMEDTFTDCPLYEQTYWVGDARNESLFAYDTFGATDIALRCLRLAAQSLERYPLVGGQVPSCWDMLLPAWSFLWGIAVWDYYFYTGDRAALAELWPAVVRNLEGAEELLDGNGLFSGKFWNMFDWTPVDDHHETVLHNSLLLIGALDAAEKMAWVLGDPRKDGGDGQQADWLAGLRARLADAVNRWWDPAKGAYPDSIHEDGTPSPSTCMHTSFLALLYDVIPPERRAAALTNTLTPPEGMVRVGSPFAILYLYEALAKAGRPEAILASIYQNYLPMLAAGATTVWEVFPTSDDRPGGFPTRSHTHAWSAAPLHFLPQVVLGIRQTAPGGAAYTISPWLGDLQWAKGTLCTARGPLEVSWRRDGQVLELAVHAPEGVQIHFEPNPSLEGLEVKLV